MFRFLRGKVNAHWLINTTLNALRGFVPSAREPWSRADKSYLHMENRRLIEKEFQAKCTKGHLNGFGCNTKLLLESSLAEEKRLQLRIGCMLYQRRGVRVWSKWILQ